METSIDSVWRQLLCAVTFPGGPWMPCYDGISMPKAIFGPQARGLKTRFYAMNYPNHYINVSLLIINHD